MKLTIYLSVVMLALAIGIPLMVLSPFSNDDSETDSAPTSSPGIEDQQLHHQPVNTPRIDKFTEQDHLSQAVYEMMVNAGRFQLDDPGDGWYRGISKASDLRKVTINDGRYRLSNYFDPGYETFYHIYDIQVLGSVYIAQGSP